MLSPGPRQLSNEPMLWQGNFPTVSKELALLFISYYCSFFSFWLNGVLEAGEVKLGDSPCCKV